MDCATARHVWNHEGGLLAGLKCRMPGLIEHLSSLVASYKRRDKDPFDTAVKTKAGHGSYQVAHMEEDSDLARWQHDVLGDVAARRALEIELGREYGIANLRLGNICCKGCIVADGDLGDDLQMKIQLAAVNTNPDGTSYIA